MRVCPALIVLAACALAAGCSKSRSSGTGALAVSTIGPEGGIVVVDGGSQQGLVLEVPAGALSEPVQFFVYDEVLPLSPTAPGNQTPGSQANGSEPTSTAPQAGQPFRIEPVDLTATIG
ncbi:MAG: hypothetical protein KAI24_26425, partial [Planctomycetes bacterium]|nr:hypothetical protein [Planctomycetota bacterium]